VKYRWTGPEEHTSIYLSDTQQQQQHTHTTFANALLKLICIRVLDFGFAFDFGGHHNDQIDIDI